MKKEYEAPQVVTYSEDEIVEMLGPAQTCSPSPCPYLSIIEHDKSCSKKAGPSMAPLFCFVSMQL